MSKRFHATPKSVLAVLACLTLLCSLFAFSLTVFADPAEDYSPSRYLKISNTDNAQPQLSLKLPAEQYPVSSGPYTLSVMIKTENVTGDNPNVEILNGWTDLEEELGSDTEGYVSREYTIETPGDAIRVGFISTYGDLYIADLVIKDKDGVIKYSLNWDDTLFGMTEFADTATWTSSLYHTGGTATFSVYNEVSPADYEPTRYLKLSNPVEGSDAQPCFELNLPAEQFPTSGAPYTVSVNFKLENITGDNPNLEVRNGFTELEDTLGATTEGYVSREYTFDVPGDKLRFGVIFTSGDIYIADLVIRDKDGIIRYGLNSDATLNGMTEFANTDTWTTFLYSGGAVTFSAYTSEDHDISRDTAYENNAEPEPEPEAPEFDPGAAPPDTGDINRSLTISNEEKGTSQALLSFMRDDCVIPDGLLVDPNSTDGPYKLTAADGPYALVGKMKLTGFEGEKAVISVNNQEKITLTADTDGWVDIKDASGNYLLVDLNDVEYMITLGFGLVGATGDFAVADLRLVDQDNTIVYSLANDTFLYGLTDLSKAMTQYKAIIDDEFEPTFRDYAGWEKGQDSVGDFTLLTKTEEYIPNKVLTLVVDEDHVAQNPILMYCNAYDPQELWANGPYTITGKMRIDRFDRMDSSQTPSVSFAGKGYGKTDGWISLADQFGDVYSFEQAYNTAHMGFSIYYAYATVSFADIVIYDKDGNVVFDMANIDEADGYYAQGAMFGGDGQESIGLLLSSYMGSGTQAILTTNPEPVEHTADDYIVPSFVETGLDGDFPSIDDDPGNTDDPIDNPEMGVETPIALCVTLGTVALAGMALLVVYKKRVRQ